MDIKWIQFDLDNTLVDFNDASKLSFKAVAKNVGIDYSDEAYANYKGVNHQVWSEFEQGIITAEVLRGLRFDRYFELIDQRPCSGIEFNTAYLTGIIEETTIYSGVHDLLKSLMSHYKLSIITNGLKEVQRPRLKRLDMDTYFDSIIVSDEIGVAKPQKEYFAYAHQSIKSPPAPEHILVVGDSLQSDILGGNEFGSKTCWISHGKELAGEVRPDYIIDSILDFKSIL